MTRAVLKIRDIADEANVSETTVRRAWAKWSSGEDDGAFPPPLKRKQAGRAYVTLRRDFEAWLDAWPDA